MTAGRTVNARPLRRDQTDAEAALWRVLRNRGLGVKFRRQYPVGRYIADFACIEHGLIVELDGGQHAEEAARAYDAERTRFLGAAGFRVLRFWNNEVLTNLEGVAQVIQQALPLLPSPGGLAELRSREGPGVRGL